jgi:hypothetical protein
MQSRQAVGQDASMWVLTEPQLIQSLGKSRLEFDDVFGLGVSHNSSEELDSALRRLSWKRIEFSHAIA